MSCVGDCTIMIIEFLLIEKEQDNLKYLASVGEFICFRDYIFNFRHIASTFFL